MATIRPWNIERFEQWSPPDGFAKFLITTKEGLTQAALMELQPRYVFFPHWSWIIPPAIADNFECVLFHMTDLPFGRGGSPLQNLIARGIYQTQISAIRVSAGLDEGPVYLKRPLDLAEGSAQELFEKMSTAIFEMMSEIVRTRPEPKAQVGEPTFFKRRTPEESQIPAGRHGRQLYDFIRMLDAEGYPRACSLVGGQQVEFFDAQLNSTDEVTARAIFKTPRI